MFSITLKLVYVYHYIKRYAQQYIENINKNILNNFLIAASYCTRTLLFKKLPSPAPASTPESESTPVLHRGYHQIRQRYIKFYEISVKYGEIFTRPHAKTCHYKMHVHHNVSLIIQFTQAGHVVHLFFAACHSIKPKLGFLYYLSQGGLVYPFGSQCN